MSDRIDELADQLAEKSLYWTPGGFHDSRVDFFKDALRELDAEHEKQRVADALEWKKEFEKRNQFAAEKDAEIAELKSQLLALQQVCEKQREALNVLAEAGWGVRKNSTAINALALQPDLSLLEEVRSVLVQVALVDGKEEWDATKFDAEKLLTKLGS